MRSLQLWVGVNRTTSCEKSVSKSVIMLEKLRGALQMKMTATCGIQKFRWREKIKHLSKYWGVVNTGRPLQVKYWGVATPATPAALTPMNLFYVDLYLFRSIFTQRRFRFSFRRCLQLAVVLCDGVETGLPCRHQWQNCVLRVRSTPAGDLVRWLSATVCLSRPTGGAKCKRRIRSAAHIYRTVRRFAFNY